MFLSLAPPLPPPLLPLLLYLRYLTYTRGVHTIYSLLIVTKCKYTRVVRTKTSKIYISIYSWYLQRDRLITYRYTRITSCQVYAWNMEHGKKSRQSTKYRTLKLYMLFRGNYAYLFSHLSHMSQVDQQVLPSENSSRPGYRRHTGTQASVSGVVVERECTHLLLALVL